MEQIMLTLFVCGIIFAMYASAKNDDIKHLEKRLADDNEIIDDLLDRLPEPTHAVTVHPTALDVTVGRLKITNPDADEPASIEDMLRQIKHQNEETRELLQTIVEQSKERPVLL